MLIIKNITFSFNKKNILHDLSLEMKKGEIVSLVGLSGSGKTTLFRLITSLYRPTEGQIIINGRPSPEGSFDVAYMQQEDLLLPWRDILSNLLLISELGNKKNNNSKNFEQKARDLLAKVGLAGFEHYYPHQLSGGMRQRVSLARALLQDKPLLLLDEPFGFLDVVLREELYKLVENIAILEGITVFFVTHDFRDAISLSQRVLVLSKKRILGDIALSPKTKLDPAEMELTSQTIKKLLQESR